MYTEFHFNSELSKDTPSEVIIILRVMLQELSFDAIDFPLPDAPLFKTERWRTMLVCDSYYFDADTHSTLRFDDLNCKKGKSYFLCIRCNLKNYDSEIEKFVDWIDPYLEDKDSGDFLGFSRYEESEDPVIIRKKEKILPTVKDSLTIPYRIDPN